MRRFLPRITTIHWALLAFVLAMLALLLACSVRLKETPPAPRAKYSTTFTAHPVPHR